jgi:predicted ATPase
MEEPELGLHPDALSLVAELLVAASARMQIIVTTHSDVLVSALTDHVESVLVCEHRGSTQLASLDAERLTHWLDKYRLGDLWRMGELGGNP